MFRGEWTYLSLGSNLGDRGAQLGAAVACLRQWPEVGPCRTSGVYETQPLGTEDAQPDYWNLCVRLRVELEALEVLRRCLSIESRAGRPARGREGPRFLDIDLLAHRGERSWTSELRLPHPRMEGRRFVLEPLLEFARDLRLSDGALLRELCAQPEMRAQRVRRIGEFEDLCSSTAGVFA